MKKKTAGIILCMAALCIGLPTSGPALMVGKGKVEMETGIFFKKDPGDAYFANDLGVTDIGDPFVLKTENDGYYMYCTSAPDGFYCWHSDDMVRWGDRKMCYVRRPDAWCTDCFWAPEVVFYGGKYYMYYTAKNQSGSLRIGLAVSKKPDGPFLDVKNDAFFDFGYACIDANVLLDSDGKKYLYYARDCSENIDGVLRKSEIYGVRLSDDLLSTEGEAVKLLTPEQRWEKASGDTQWNEGPEMITSNGKYYLTYSANFFASPSYSLGYAVSDNPLGPFIKAEENPILTSGIRRDVSGTGHHSFTQSPDGSQLWAVYHSHTDLDNPGGNRKVNIDRAGFTADGKLYINGPVTALQPVPSGKTAADVTGLFTVSAESADAALLTDGFFSIYKKNRNMDVKLPAADGKADILLRARKPVTVSGIAVYPGQDGLADIRGIRLCMDETLYSEEYTVEQGADSPIILSFDPVNAERIRLTVLTKENVVDVTLSEITIIQENQ